MDQEFRIPTKSQERVQNRDIIHDCISNFAGHNCGQELKYSCSCKVGFTVPCLKMNTVKTPNKRKIGRALFFSYREFSLTRSFSKV